VAVNLVNVEAVGKTYGTRKLLDSVSLGVSEGDRIGVVGRNGDGKTTLVRMLARLEEPDTGRVTHQGGLRLGLLTQTDTLDPAATVRHEVVGDRADHEWAGDAKIRDVLTGLFGGLDLPGFPAGLDTVIGPLSGGERRRIALAKLLIDEQDLVVLDEPTNHLDLATKEMLVEALREFEGTMIFVSHDRTFLRGLGSRVLELGGENGAARQPSVYPGSYIEYVQAMGHEAPGIYS